MSWYPTKRYEFYPQGMAIKDLIDGFIKMVESAGRNKHTLMVVQMNRYILIFEEGVMSD